jgi:predicted MFS family arabinose efflux permease
MKRVRVVNAPGHWMVLALALSLGAAVSLGITRFSYGLLLPAMRADLAWSYALAGVMNTANALGYFLGALAAPWMMRRWGPSTLLWLGALFASFFMVLSGFFTQTEPLLLQRLMAGIASAAVFVAGGLLAARLGAQDPPRSALLLGIYYGGTGLGIVVSSGVVFWVLDVTALQAHGWRWAWWCLGALCLLACVVLRWPARAMAGLEVVVASGGLARADRFRWQQFGFGLSAYALFGVGYIGYMTFVVALLRTQGRTALEAACFYALLGAAVMVSGRLWAGLLERHRDGRPLAVLNGLLGMATILPAWTQAWPLVLLSGALFGAVFLSVVASTTALVRHNLAQSAWASGIGAFTAVFALGQIVGPTVVGWIADGAGGLERGLWCSALALWAGALLATRQRSLVT